MDFELPRRGNAKTDMKVIVKFMGIRLIGALMNSASEGDFITDPYSTTVLVFRSISKPKLIERVSSGLMVYNDVLWMRILEMQSGRESATGGRWFEYVPFWQPGPPKGKRVYLFRINFSADPRFVVDIRDCYPNAPLIEDYKPKDVWSYHSF